MFATGNAGWDQGLNSLAGSLFPDPSKQAQAGYYGAETAQALTKNYQLRDQMGQQRYLQDLMARGGVGPTPIPGQAAPPGPEAPPGLVIPGTNAGAPPPQAPPQPGAGSPGPAITPTNFPPAVPAPPGTPSPGPPGAVLPSLLAKMVSGGAPPVPSGTGTDGKPMPPDPSLSGPFGMHPGTAQPPGGGVMQSPPAAANGSPAPLMVNLPYLMATAARAGYDPNVVKLLGTSWINGQIQSGAMDKATGERFLSGAGDSAPLNATTQITTTGMNNATTLANTRLQGQNQINLRNLDPVQVDDPNNPGHPLLVPPTQVQQGGFHAPNVTQAADDRTPMTVIAPNGTLIPTTKGEWLKNPAMGRPQNQYDQQPVTVQPPAPPGGPLPPPTMTSTGQATATGQTPYEPAQAQHDKNNISIVTPQGEVVTTTEGGLRANPGLGRRYDPAVDGALVASVDPVTHHTIWRLSRNAEGTRVGPQTTDQGNAQAGTRIQGLAEEGSPLTDTVTEAFQRSQQAQVPRQTITPEQQQRITGLSTQHFQEMYPVPSGSHVNTSTKPAVPREDMRALHDNIARQLELTSFRNNPAAAATHAWDMMREAKILDDPTTARNVGVGLAVNEDPRLSGGDKPNLIVGGNMANVKNLVWPGGGPRAAPSGFKPPQPTSEPTPGPKSLVDTVAPKTTAPPAPTTPPVDPKAVPPGAVGVAPAGAADGTILRAKNGTNGVVRGGFVFPAPGTAGQ
jgi:hypothetical protein